jgi:hypothetical protein
VSLTDYGAPFRFSTPNGAGMFWFYILEACISFTKLWRHWQGKHVLGRFDLIVLIVALICICIHILVLVT